MTLQDQLIEQKKKLRKVSKVKEYSDIEYQKKMNQAIKRFIRAKTGQQGPPSEMAVQLTDILNSDINTHLKKGVNVARIHDFNSQSVYIYQDKIEEVFGTPIFVYYSLEDDTLMIFVDTKKFNGNKKNKNLLKKLLLAGVFIGACFFISSIFQETIKHFIIKTIETSSIISYIQSQGIKNSNDFINIVSKLIEAFYLKLLYPEEPVEMTILQYKHASVLKDTIPMYANSDIAVWQLYQYIRKHAYHAFPLLKNQLPSPKEIIQIVPLNSM